MWGRGDHWGGPRPAAPGDSELLQVGPRVTPGPPPFSELTRQPLPLGHQVGGLPDLDRRALCRLPVHTLLPLNRSLACRYQQILHRNLVYLATIADSNQNMQSLLPAVSACHGVGGPGVDSVVQTFGAALWSRSGR